MAWLKAVSEARQWAATNSRGFALASEDEKARKISFSGSCASFYVTVPESEERVRSCHAVCPAH